MAKLTVRKRRALPKSAFGVKKSRTTGKPAYPMPDRAHAIAAKGRAKQELTAGRLSRSAYEAILAKADRKLKGS